MSDLDRYTHFLERRNLIKKDRMSRSQPLPYLEAYPQLYLSELKWGGRREVSWYNEHRSEIGHAVSEWIADYSVRLVYSLDRTPEIYSQSSVMTLQVEPQKHGIERWRQTVVCHGCTKLVTRLIFRNIDWLCCKCQGLRNRSTFLTPEQRASEEFSQLQREIGDGRPPTMREKEYQRKLVRLSMLSDRSAQGYRRSPVDFYGGVYAEWR